MVNLHRIEIGENTGRTYEKNYLKHLVLMLVFIQQTV
jgi:hypothetical protein